MNLVALRLINLVGRQCVAMLAHCLGARACMQIRCASLFRGYAFFWGFAFWSRVLFTDPATQLFQLVNWVGLQIASIVCTKFCRVNSCPWALIFGWNSVFVYFPFFIVVYMSSQCLKDCIRNHRWECRIGDFACSIFRHSPNSFNTLSEKAIGSQEKYWLECTLYLMWKGLVYWIL